MLYPGGVYEWALLSFAHPNSYTFYSLKNKALLDRPEVEAYFSRMEHQKESVKKVQVVRLRLRKRVISKALPNKATVA